MFASAPRRSLLAILSGLALLIVVIYAVASRILLSGFRDAEQTNSLINGARIEKVIENQVIALDTVALGWTQWDQAARFVRNEDADYNREFVAQECNVRALSDTMGNAAAYLDENGKVLFAASFDSDSQALRPFPSKLRALIEPGSPFLRLPKSDSYTRGLVNLSEGVMMVVARPVTRSNGSGPIEGTFVLGRYFDSGMAQQMSTQIQLPVKLQGFGAATRQPLDASFARSARALRVPDSAQIYTEIEDQNTSFVFLRSLDINGNPALLTRLDLPRTIYQQGLSSLRALLSSVVIISLLSGLVLLSSQYALSRARAEQRQRDELYRSLTLHSSDLLFTLDLSDSSMLWFGDSAGFFGSAASTPATAAAWLQWVAPTDRNLCERILREADEKGFIGELQLQREGENFYVLLRGKALQNKGEPTRVIGAVTDITARRKSELEKEVLLKEIHHRVKNNMQVISSMLNLQSSFVADPVLRTAFQDSQNRIKSMALIHERLYGQSDLARVNFAEYLEQLTRSLARTYSTGAVQLDLDLEPIELDIDRAVPCGLIVNELVSNAFKHAFPSRQGALKIKLGHNDAKQVEICIEDNGIGIAPHIDLENSDSLGLQLVDDFSAQIDGTMKLERLSQGTRWRLCFPVEAEN